MQKLSLMQESSNINNEFVRVLYNIKGKLAEMEIEIGKNAINTHSIPYCESWDFTLLLFLQCLANSRWSIYVH